MLGDIFGDVIVINYIFRLQQQDDWVIDLINEENHG